MMDNLAQSLINGLQIVDVKQAGPSPSATCQTGEKHCPKFDATTVISTLE